MKEYPILMNSEMASATLAGKKTQTRRPVNPQPKVVHALYPNGELETNCLLRNPKRNNRIRAPYGPVGSRLWVRETCQAFSPRRDKDYIKYLADGEVRKMVCTSDEWRWLWQYRGAPYFQKVPSIHMPRWASRITLEVTALRVERLHSMTPEEVRAEGATHPEFDLISRDYMIATGWHRSVFRPVWNAIYSSKPGLAWSDNPWVWVYEFKVIEPNGGGK